MGGRRRVNAAGSGCGQQNGQDVDAGRTRSWNRAAADSDTELARSSRAAAQRARAQEEGNWGVERRSSTAGSRRAQRSGQVADADGTRERNRAEGACVSELALARGSRAAAQREREQEAGGKREERRSDAAGDERARQGGNGEDGTRGRDGGRAAAQHGTERSRSSRTAEGATRSSAGRVIPSGTSGEAQQVTAERDLLCVCGKRCASLGRLAVHQDSCEQFKAAEHARRPSSSCHYCPWTDEGRASESVLQQQSTQDSLLQLARYRTVSGMTRDSVEGVKACVKATMQRAHAQLKEKLASRLGHEAAGLEELVRGVFAEAGDLGGRDSELDVLRSSDAYVKPVRRYLGTCPESKEDFYAYDAPLDQNLR